MVRVGDQRSLLLCFSTPKNKDYPSRLLINQFDNPISHEFPTPSSMGIGRVRSNRQYSIQHKHPLTGPWFQMSIVWHPTSDVVMEFAIYIFE